MLHILILVGFAIVLLGGLALLLKASGPDKTVTVRVCLLVLCLSACLSNLDVSGLPFSRMITLKTA